MCNICCMTHCLLVPRFVSRLHNNTQRIINFISQNFYVFLGFKWYFRMRREFFISAIKWRNNWIILMSFLPLNMYKLNKSAKQVCYLHFTLLEFCLMNNSHKQITRPARYYTCKNSEKTLRLFSFFSFYIYRSLWWVQSKIEKYCLATRMLVLS